MNTAIARTGDYQRVEVRDVLLDLREQEGGLLKPRSVVEAARDENSPLHHFFEWDDGAAAEAFRLVQAEGLIRRVKIAIVREGRGGRDLSLSVTREYQSRPSMRSIGYESVQDIMSDPDKKQEMLDQAFRELTAFEKRYRDLEELSSLFEVIDGLKP
jgi:hypothetical protein